MRTNHALALVAAVLGTLALLAGGTDARSSGGTNGLVTAIENGQDEIAPLTLAGWIMDGRDGVRIIDLRTADAFEAANVPTSENLALTELVGEDAVPGTTVVLYGDGARAGQAWALLRSKGQDARILRGGLGGWLRDVMSPVLPENAPPEAHEAFEETKVLSRYFGGTPRIGPAIEPLDLEALPIPGARGAASPPVEDAAAGIRRRGCAF